MIAAAHHETPASCRKRLALGDRLCSLENVDDLTRRQLDSVADVLAAAQRRRVEVWLRGGWAVDFALGRITRRHVDVDWFAWREDLRGLVDDLVQQGWSEVGEHPREQQRDLHRRGVDLGFAPLARALDGSVVVGGGPWAGAPWPARMLEDAMLGQLGDLRSPVISPAAQVEIKQMMPLWVPGRPRREKDLADIRLLRHR